MTSAQPSDQTWSSSNPEHSSSSDSLPVTFADLGVKQEAKTVETLFGKRRPLSSLTPKEWAFAIISTLSILGAAGLTIERIINSDKNSSDLTLAMVLLLTIGFCLLYVINGLFGERPYELLIFIIGTLLLMIYVIVNFVQTVKTIETSDNKVKLARLILIVAAGPINIVLGAIIAREYYLSRNLIFRTVGANLDLQNLCSKIFFTESLFKMDIQLELSLIILVLKQGVLDVNTLETVVIALGTVYAITWFILGFLTIRYENKILAWILLLTSIFEPIYIIYKAVDLGMEWTDGTKVQNIKAAIILAVIAGLFVRVTLCGYVVYVYRNFGKGMKEKAYGALRSPPPPAERT